MFDAEGRKRVATGPGKEDDDQWALTKFGRKRTRWSVDQKEAGEDDRLLLLPF